MSSYYQIYCFFGFSRCDFQRYWLTNIGNLKRPNHSESRPRPGKSLTIWISVFILLFWKWKNIRFQIDSELNSSQSVVLSSPQAENFSNFTFRTRFSFISERLQEKIFKISENIFKTSKFSNLKMKIFEYFFILLWFVAKLEQAIPPGPFSKPYNL